MKTIHGSVRGAGAAPAQPLSADGAADDELSELRARRRAELEAADGADASALLMELDAAGLVAAVAATAAPRGVECGDAEGQRAAPSRAASAESAGAGGSLVVHVHDPDAPACAAVDRALVALAARWRAAPEDCRALAGGGGARAVVFARLAAALEDGGVLTAALDVIDTDALPAILCYRDGELCGARANAAIADGDADAAEDLLDELHLFD